MNEIAEAIALAKALRELREKEPEIAPLVQELLPAILLRNAVSTIAAKIDFLTEFLANEPNYDEQMNESLQHIAAELKEHARISAEGLDGVGAEVAHLANVMPFDDPNAVMSEWLPRGEWLAKKKAETSDVELKCSKCGAVVAAKNELRKVGVMHVCKKCRGHSSDD
jgi:predicted RNA-binding Zn-ribbon protein involved in translation (DUF1610 family)